MSGVMMAGFINSCPKGSNLKIEVIPALAMAGGQDAKAVAIGTKVKLSRTSS
jgi:hypothetical protein